MQRGFSLVETIVAASLVAAALVALAQFVAVGMQSGAAARARAATTLMAEQKMEQIRAMPWSEIAATPGVVTDYLDASGNQQCVNSGAACGDAVFVRRWSATATAFSTDVLFIEVDVHLVAQGHGATTLVTARARTTP
jgi:prepilin-type N-terminal cleavage/methylation domain-containing protein